MFNNSSFNTGIIIFRRNNDDVDLLLTPLHLLTTAYLE